MSDKQNISSLNTLVNLQTQTKVDDGYGGSTSTWVNKYTNVWAEFTTPTGSDIYKYGRMIEQLTMKIIIRYNPFIRQGWRVVISKVVSGDPAFYRVKYVVDSDGKRNYLSLFCEELL